jgi:ATP-dependent RNA helicase RhlE
MTTTFSDLGLSPPLLLAIDAQGYEVPTPIQTQAIPHLLEGRDVLGTAQTGTGKTAAFALPIIQLLSRGEGAVPQRPSALVLTPTRELAAQIGDSFEAYGQHTRIRATVVFGGVGQRPQTDALRRGVDVLVATPGRLLDLMSQRHVHLGDVEILVLDEADRMLDMGFLPDVTRILDRLPKQKQSLLFSATMPKTIVQLAARLLNDPVRVAVAPVSATADRIEQRVLFVDRVDKRALLGEILRDEAVTRALVFTRTKHRANQVAKQLKGIDVRAEAIHGNKSQTARQKALDAFKRGRVRVLVATDIAARGIDVDGITHVINYDLPNVPESYVHRIGRTARAGTDGAAISLCDADEQPYLQSIERLIKKRVPVFAEHRYHRVHAAAAAESKPQRRRRPPRNRRRNRR